MIQFLLDENISPAVGQFFRDKGFQVKEVRELLSPGAQDDAVMALARQERMILVTFDKHFSNLLAYPPGSHDGIIRIRIHPPLIGEIINAFNQLFERFDIKTMEGSLLVLEREGFRVRRAPLG
jgi:predicted nuclease of predicted toxin-antitoxin system